MSMYWAYGVSPDGEDELLGPFDLHETAGLEAEMADLRGVRIVTARRREDAMRQVQGVPRQQRSLLSADQPAPGIPDRFSDDV